MAVHPLQTQAGGRVGAGAKCQARVQHENMHRIRRRLLVSWHYPKPGPEAHGFETVQPGSLPLLIFKFSETDLLRPIHSGQQAKHPGQGLNRCVTAEKCRDTNRRPQGRFTDARFKYRVIRIICQR